MRIPTTTQISLIPDKYIKLLIEEARLKHGELYVFNFRVEEF